MANHVSDLITHLSIPLNFSALYFRLIMRPPPQAAFKGKEDAIEYDTYLLIYRYKLPNLAMPKKEL